MLPGSAGGPAGRFFAAVQQPAEAEPTEPQGADEEAVYAVAAE